MLTTDIFASNGTKILPPPLNVTMRHIDLLIIQALNVFGQKKGSKDRSRP